MTVLSPTRQRLAGTWELVSYEVSFGDGTTIAPYGSKPYGLLFYGADGFMSAHMMDPGRPLLGADSTTASPEAAQAALGTHVSYAGTYRLESDTVIHTTTISSLQDMVGLDLRRRIELEGDRLTLRTGHLQMTFGGKPGTASLVWCRTKNS